MKSIHWLITFISIWGSSAVASILIEKPLIMVTASVTSIVIVIALGLTGKMHESEHVYEHK